MSGTRSITILGSTGSIGESTLRVIRSAGRSYRINGLACGSNTDQLENQIREFSPEAVAVHSRDAAHGQGYSELKKAFPDVTFLEGEEGVVELARRERDILVSAISGSAGLRPTMAAVDNCKRIAIANKETLVMAGTLFMGAVEKAGVELIPVDSEHSAVFSLLENLRRDDVSRIILTASGGSLRDVSLEELEGISPEEALKHPNWDMGSKITIDSATLMNKGLEVIEAHYLFGYDYGSIGVIIHPESIVHSLVETVDGAMYAHMSVTDMALPIQNALTWPEKAGHPFGRLELETIGSLNFSGVDSLRYPALELCYEAGTRGGTAPSLLNGANEAAVGLFLAGKIYFTDIVKTVEKALQNHRVVENPTLDDIFDADSEGREFAHRL